MPEEKHTCHNCYSEATQEVHAEGITIYLCDNCKEDNYP